MTVIIKPVLATDLLPWTVLGKQLETTSYQAKIFSTIRYGEQNIHSASRKILYNISIYLLEIYKLTMKFSITTLVAATACPAELWLSHTAATGRPATHWQLTEPLSSNWTPCCTVTESLSRNWTPCCTVTELLSGNWTNCCTVSGSLRSNWTPCCTVTESLSSNWAPHWLSHAKLPLLQEK